MTLPASGTITLSQIAAEFGGTAPHNLTEYYRGGTYVANTPANSGIPTSGAIKLTDFYGASAFSAVSRTYTTGSSATETAPAGCSNVLIGVWGGGGAGGGCGRFSGVGGDGGSAGGFAYSSYAISGGQTLTYTVGAGGTVSGLTSNPGGASSVSSGTKTITTMTANGGAANGGSGGSASGGTSQNTTGTVGSSGTDCNVDGVGFGGGGAPGTSKSFPDGSKFAGTGGDGADVSSPDCGLTAGANTPGGVGAAGMVVFYYT